MMNLTRRAGGPTPLMAAMAAAALASGSAVATDASAQSQHSAHVSTVVSSFVGNVFPGAVGVRSATNSATVSGPANGVASTSATLEGSAGVGDDGKLKGTYSGGAFATAGMGHLGVSATNSVLASEQNTVVNMADAVTASMFDLVTLKSLGDDHTTSHDPIIWLAKLTLSGDISGNASASAGGGLADAGYSGSLSVVGTGLQPCSKQDICMSKTTGVSDSPDGRTTQTTGAPLVSNLTWQMDLRVDNPTPIALIMTLLGGPNSRFVSGLGAASATFDGNFAHTLLWDDGAIFIDAITGERVNDVVLVSDSGFDYEHSGFGGGGAPVPEPAAWALLILGFGALGARLRQARSSPSAAM